jgi:hypothetical protein
MTIGPERHSTTGAAGRVGAGFAGVALGWPFATDAIANRTLNATVKESRLIAVPPVQCLSALRMSGPTNLHSKKACRNQIAICAVENRQGPMVGRSRGKSGKDADRKV